MKFLFSLLTLLMVNKECKSAQTNLEANSQNKDMLKGTYIISEVNTEALGLEAISISFDAGTNKVSGFAGCNRFFGNYITEGNSITFKNIASIKKYCLEKQNAIETKVLTAINSASSFVIKDNVLSLLSNNKVILKTEASSDFKTVSSKADMIGDHYVTTSATYTVTSRGFYQSIDVTEGKITIARDRNPENKQTSVCKPDDWREIEAMVKAIDTKTLQNIKAPSNKHVFDGAQHATLSIRKGDMAVMSPTFDHGNPPKEIGALVNKLLSLAENRGK